MEITGIIKAMGQVTQVQGKDGKVYDKQEFVVEEVNQQYPQSVALTLLGGKVEQYSPMLRVGALVTAKFDGKARMGSNGGYFNSLNCWAVTLAGATPLEQYAQQPAQQAPPF